MKVSFNAVVQCKHNCFDVQNLCENKTGKLGTTRVLVNYTDDGLDSDYFIAYRTQDDIGKELNDISFINNTVKAIKKPFISKKYSTEQLIEKLIKPLWKKTGKEMPDREIQSVYVDNIALNEFKKDYYFEMK